MVVLEALLDGHPTDCWNVSTGEGYSVRQVIEAVERVTEPFLWTKRRAAPGTRRCWWPKQRS